VEYRKKPRTGNRKGLVAVLTVILCGIIQLTTAIPVAAQNTETGTDISPDVPRQYNNFTLSIYVKTENRNNLQIGFPELPDSVRLIAGPYIRPLYSHQRPEGTDFNTVIRYTLMSRAGGRFILGSIDLKLPERTLHTDRKIIKIMDARTGRIPYDFRWEIPHDQLYLGQSVPAILWAEKMPDLQFPERVEVETPEGAIFEEAPRTGEIATNSVGDTALYSIPISGYMVTPTRKGTLTIAAPRIIYENFTEEGPSFEVPVEEQPAAIQETGAIGDFNYYAWVEKQNITTNVPLKLTIKVEGTGNLGYLEIPYPEPDGMELLSKTRHTNFEPAPTGYRGSVELVCTYQIEKPGNISMGIPAFLYLDPDSGTIRKSKSYTFNITAEKPETEAALSPEKLSLSLLTIQELTEYPNFQIYHNPWFVLLFFPGFIVLMVVVIARKFNIKRLLAFLGGAVLLAAAIPEVGIEKLEQAQAQFDSGNHIQAAEQYADLFPDLKHHPGIAYNAGVSYIAGGEFGEGLFYFRKAVREAPMNAFFGNTLDKVEKAMGLENQFSPRYPVHPDYVYLLLAVLFNAACFISSGALLKRKGMFFIAAVLSVSLVVATAVVFIGGVMKQYELTGVVITENPDLLRIPSKEATVFSRLSEGVSVQVSGSANGYIFIKTPRGEEGWVQKQAMWMNTGKEDENGFRRDTGSMGKGTEQPEKSKTEEPKEIEQK